MSSSQFNLSYLPLEDRLLFQLNSSDKENYKFLLTRRITRQLISGFEEMFNKSQELLADESGSDEPLSRQKALQAFKHQTAVEQADFDTPFDEETDKAPLGSDAILLHTIQLSLLSSEEVLVKFLLDENKSLDMTLDNQSLHGLYHIFVKSAQTAEWDLDEAKESINPMLAPGGPTIN